jgi:hypothetical protein
MAMGELFSLSFYKDIPWVLAAGGSKGEIAVWDTEESESVAKHFTPFLDKSLVPEDVSEDEEEEKGEYSSDEEVKKGPAKKKEARKDK